MRRKIRDDVNGIWGVGFWLLILCNSKNLTCFLWSSTLCLFMIGNRLLFFRHIPLFTFLFLILVMNFHTWWHCHPISVPQAQLSSHNSVISCLWITDRWLLSCASETKIRWQRHQVWKFTNNICKSKILLKKCSLDWTPMKRNWGILSEAFKIQDNSNPLKMWWLALPHSKQIRYELPHIS